MDFEKVRKISLQALSAASMLNAPASREQIMDVIDQNKNEWRSKPDLIRLYTRAIQLLVDFNYLQPDSTAMKLMPSPKGIKAINNEIKVTYPAEHLEDWIKFEEAREALDSKAKIGANSFGVLELNRWRQFENIYIDFHSRLTVITGPNAVGKTTVLNILASHLNWNVQLLSISKKIPGNVQDNIKGSLTYTNGGSTPLVDPPSEGVKLSALAMPFFQAVPGMYISSHRSVSSYRALEALPPRFSETQSLLDQFSSEIQVRYAGGSSQYSPLYRMKESLIAAAMYAYGSKALRPNDSARQVWEEFQLVLKDFLPTSLGFKELIVDDAELIIRTDSAEFLLEAVSGGISAMLELSWQIFLRSRDQESFTVCIDEPENHLHPELQRTIMPGLLSAFPDVKFIVATHSPFVVTSFKEAKVYALSKESELGITSREIISTNFLATADETLSSVLGLDTTLPVWAEDKVDDLLSQISDNPSIEELRGLRAGLEELGLARQFPNAIKSITSNEGLYDSTNKAK